MIERLVGILALGLALAIAGCGSDDKSAPTCEGADATLVGSCELELAVSCVEFRGGYTLQKAQDACIGGTFSAEACPLLTRIAGGCVTSALGLVTISYNPALSLLDGESACEEILSCFEAP